MAARTVELRWRLAHGEHWLVGLCPWVSQQKRPESVGGCTSVSLAEQGRRVGTNDDLGDLNETKPTAQANYPIPFLGSFPQNKKYMEIGGCEAFWGFVVP